MEGLRQQNNTGVLAIQIATVGRGGGVSPYNRPSVPPEEEIDLSYLDRIDNAPEWSMLSEEDKKEYGYNRAVTPKKRVKVIYIMRRR